MIHEALRRMVCRIIAAPVAVPRLPAPLLGIVTIYPRSVNSFVKTGRVFLEPLPLVVVVRLHKARLVVEVPRTVELSVPLPEPVPEVHILLGPRDPT